MNRAPEKIDYRTLLTDAYVELKKSRAALVEYEKERFEPIAVVGVGCRLPGGVETPNSFWKLLIDGQDAIGEIPGDRWDVDAFYDEDRDRPGKMYTRQGGFLDEVDKFDAGFFGIAPREAQELDPQHRLLLEVAWEALEDAGETPAENSQTGVFIGLFMGDYAQLGFNSGNPEEISAYNCTGSLRAMSAGRLSYTFGFHGPALQLDTACSSSLLAIHLACQSLRLRESDRALAGGVNLILTPDATIGVCRLGALSADGRCKTFSSSADGYGRGEGCGIVVLKRLSDAVNDGNRILALIRGSAVNHDGRSNGLTAPNGAAQESVIRAALANARIEPAQVQYVETHGTGTLLGDPIEALALGEVLNSGRASDAPLVVGSVKTNFGHLEAAAGVAGVIKTVLALGERTIPPHLYFDSPNPHIPWDSLRFKVPSERISWVRHENARRIAGVSAFGMSGTNAHVILEEAPEREDASNPIERPRNLLCLSARSEKALGHLIARYEDFLSADPAEHLADTCFTASLGRKHFNHRVAIQAKSVEEVLERLRGYRAGREIAEVYTGSVAAGNETRVAFLFTGQGSQYAGMGKELYQTQPVFREALDRCHEILKDHLERPLLDVMFAADEKSASLLDETEYTQPALFALEYSLARMWRSWGVEPAILLGHSVGEYVAACIAGVFSLEDGLRLIAARGRLMQSLPRDGAMATVFAEADRVRTVLGGYGSDLSIAAINGPSNTVISGRASLVNEACGLFEKEKIRTRALKVSHAFHSALVEPVLEAFGREARSVRYAAPQIRLISNLTGEETEMNADYWVRQAREAVRYSDGVRRLVQAGVTACLEIGPKPALSRMASEVEELSRSGIEMWSSVDGRRDDWEVVLETLGRMYVRGVAIDWKGFEQGYVRRRVSLPGYPFERQRYWIAAGRTANQTSRSAFKAEPRQHELAGFRVKEAWSEDLRYEVELSADNPRYLQDHRIYGETIVPAAAYLEMMQWAMSNGANSVEGEIELEDATFRQALVLREGERRRVQIVTRPEGEGAYAVRVYSEEPGNENRWVLHASGKGLRGASSKDGEWESLDAIRQRCVEDVLVAGLYRSFERRGLEYGEKFRPIVELRRGDGEALARLELPSGIDDSGYRLHPVLLDGSLQAVGGIFNDNKESADETYLPVGLRKLRLFARAAGTVWVHARANNDSSADFRLYNQDGSHLAEGRGLELLPASRGALSRGIEAPVAQFIQHLRWEEQPLAVASEPRTSRGMWLILCDNDGLGRQLASLLKDTGDVVRIVQRGSRFQQTDTGDFVVDTTSAMSVDALLRSTIKTHIPLRGVVHLWGAGDASRVQLNGESLVDASHSGCEALLAIVQGLTRVSQTPRLWVATRQSQHATPGDTLSGLAHSSLWGMGRVVAAEHPELKCSLVDLSGRATIDDAESLFAELSADGDDLVVAYRDAKRYVAQIVRAGDEEISADELTTTISAFSLRPGVRRELSALNLGSITRRAVRSNEIEVEVRAAGLNFRDVLNAMGLYPGNAGALGSECAGIVISVGTAVTEFEVGDEVVVMTLGSFSSYLTVDATLAVKKPHGLSFAAAAGLPVAFLTAYYGLHNLAKLSAGEKVLIHAASGGVGMAAVQIAKMLGAEIHATASPAKWETVRALGVNHIYNSRTLDFADEILQKTGGRGVDVVLNSLSGNFIARSLEAMTPGGRFVEIGKRGVWSKEQVAEFRPKVTYFLCDLVEETEKQPDLFRDSFVELTERLASGDLRALPITDFPVGQAIDAFRLMQQARHIGKIVLTFPVALGRQSRFAADARYLITGGLGGVGLEVAKWMVERGARHLVLAGRSGANETHTAALRELEQSGAHVHVATADVSKAAAVATLIEEISGALPLRGVMHAAGVLDDGVISNQTPERFSRVFAAKALSAWHLHEQTLSSGLDFFVVFSSIASLIGSAGQSNYAAANAFLDGLAHYRHRLGLPALSVNWGPWSEVGMAARLDERETQRSASKGILTLTPKDALRVLDQLMLEESVQASAVRLADDTSLRRNAKNETTTGFAETLAQMAPAERRPAVIQYLRGQVARVLGAKSIDQIQPRQSLSDLGIDSLMTIELRNILESGLKAELSATFVFDYPTIDAMAKYLVPDELVTKQEEVDGLSESEAEELLLQELERLKY